MTSAKQVYRTRVTHIRREPWRRSFTHRSSMWVVDIDTVALEQRFGWLRGAVLAKDHLDGRAGTLRESIERFAEASDIELGAGRILLAAQPRAFGSCFNPISVWWCLDGDGDPVTTVVEVHNTYGDRHAYALRADAGGRASTDKAMYVSPFHGVDGRYEVVAPKPGDRLDLTVTLRTQDGARFSASLAGRRVDRAPWWTQLASARDAARIRAHGVRLWARGLPVQPRPDHQQEALR